MAFAENTSVSVEKSKVDLDTLLQKHGATQRGSMHDDEAGRARVFFTLAKRQIRLEVPLPKPEEKRFTHKDVYKKRHPDDARKQWEQACRSRWRVLLLFVKAKLELVAMGVSSIEREFLADVVLADGKTVYEVLCDPLERSYLTGAPLPLLGSGGPIEGTLEDPR